VVDPLVHRLHLALAARRKRTTPTQEALICGLVEKALALGPEGLTTAEKTTLLRSPEGLAKLHRQVWRLDDGEAAAQWGLTPP
jgi:membrane glycosyltransferase